MPRSTYILPSDHKAAAGSARGGIASADDVNYSHEYDLEVGQMMNCNISMLALAAHIEEVRALLKTLKDTPLAVLGSDSWLNLEKDLLRQLKEAKEMDLARPENKKKYKK